ITQTLEKKHPKAAFELDITDQYYNIREKIEPVLHVVNIAEQVLKDLQIKPLIAPIRVGTDGSQLSYMVFTTPNIFAGGMNFHGKYEFISVQDMEKAVHVIARICELFTTSE